jgi:1,4-dihydroxy-2-naphthoate octaprenyltransferase
VALAALPLAFRPIQVVREGAEGRALLPVLADTGRLQLALGVLLAVGLWL